VFGNDVGVGCHVEDPARAFDDRQERVWIREADVEEQRGVGRERRDVDRANRSADLDGPTVVAVLDDFHAWSGPHRQKRQHRVPVVGGPIRHAQSVTVDVALGPLACPSAKLGRRPLVGEADMIVEPAETSKPRRLSDLPQRQRRLVKQSLGEVHAARQRYLEWSRAEMLQKQTTKVSRGDAEPAGEWLDAPVVQRPFADQAHRAGHRDRRPLPGRSSWRRLGSASQARTISGARCRRRGREIPDVLVLGRPDRADRTAIHARGGDADEEAAVKARISRAAGAVAGTPIQIHS